MARTNKYTTIPRQGKADPQVDAIAANLELLTGQKGQGGKRAVLVEDLERLGIIGFSRGKLSLGDNVGGGGGTSPVTPPPTPPTPPPVDPPTIPTGFTATGAYQYVSFSWDVVTYNGHAYTEIFTSQSDDFSTAVRIGVTPATVFGYSVNFGWRGYAWIRHVNTVGAVGPINATNGTYVETRQDVQDLLDQLVGQIGEIHFDKDVDGQLEKLEGFQEWIEHSKAEGMLEEAVVQDTYSVERREGLLKLTARIDTEYYTAVGTDSAIASATTRLKTEIEDPNGSSVGADLYQNYYTKAGTDSAITTATTKLQADIEDPDGSSVGAKLATQYYTKVETNSAISSATTKLQSDIEDPNGSSIGADLNQNYYTKASTDNAIAIANTDLKAEIEDPKGTSLGATLANQYYTKTTTDQVIAAAITELKSDIEDPSGTSLGATLNNQYYTKVDTDGAISKANTTLRAEIENPSGSSVGADLANNYYTKVNTDNAIAVATTSLKSELEDPNGTSLGAQLDTISQTVTRVDGYQQSLWGVKASAGDVTASIGLVAKSNPSNPSIDNAYFIVQDADIRVLYTVDPGSGQEKVVPIFGTIADPNDPNKRILVIDTASIKVADIRDLVAGQIIADNIRANASIIAPMITGGQINIGNNFAVAGNGNMTFNNFTGQNGALTGRLDVGTAFISGQNSPLTSDFISTNNSNFYIRHDGFLYAKNGLFEGQVQADQIIGDIVSSITKSHAPLSFTRYDPSSVWLNAGTFDSVEIVNSRTKNRTLQISLDLGCIVAPTVNSRAASETRIRAITSWGQTYYSGRVQTWCPTGQSSEETFRQVTLAIPVPAGTSGTVTIRGEYRKVVADQQNVTTVIRAPSTSNLWTAFLMPQGGDLA